MYTAVIHLESAIVQSTIAGGYYDGEAFVKHSSSAPICEAVSASTINSHRRNPTRVYATTTRKNEAFRTLSTSIDERLPRS
jgi:hypothetical protein